VSEAGGLGFVPAGYVAPERLSELLRETRTRTPRPFGVNLFVARGGPAPASAYEAYVERLRAEAERAGAPLGEPRWDDDGWDAKLSLVAADPPAVVSFTSGCPPPAVLARLREAGAEPWVTVTSPDEARQAAAAGAAALVVQGAEAGGHRGSFSDDPEAPSYGLLALLQLVSAATDLPLVATGGIATGAGVAAVLAAGAAAAQVGSAFMLAPEAATSEVHRRALATSAPTAVTRAFTGRPAQGIRNRFMAEHEEAAPVAYPEVHYVTAPLRRAGRERGDPDLVNLWAGHAHELARPRPAAEIVRELADEAREALTAAGRRVAPR
jgi:nitronate monooxygenase